MATRFAGAANKVVNALSIEQASQVLIKVRVAEMSRTIAKQLGVNVTAAIGATATARRFSPPPTTSSASWAARSPIFRARGSARVGVECLVNALVLGCDPNPNNVQGVVQALEDIGLVHTLAEPNLTAVSGEIGEVPRRRRIPGSRVARSRRQHHRHVQAIRRRPRLHAGRARQGPHLAHDLDRSQRADQCRCVHAWRAAASPTV